ncbi:MAG: hypothetical protein COB69_09955 [Phycisphaera sp.]|nr:MAG: hypothetical protein COB69_09955 [Phycisphaera sp.]
MSTANPPKEIPFTARRHTVGGIAIHYNCPQCQAALKSPVEEAGKDETCPACMYTFVVPGVEAKKENRIREAKARETKEANASSKEALGEFVAKGKAAEKVVRAEHKEVKREGKRRKKKVKGWEKPFTSGLSFWSMVSVFVGILVLVVAILMSFLSVLLVGASLQISLTVFGCCLLINGVIMSCASAIGLEINRWGSMYAVRDHDRDND